MNRTRTTVHVLALHKNNISYTNHIEAHYVHIILLTCIIILNFCKNADYHIL